MKKAIIILIAIAAVLVSLVFSSYNALVSADEGVKNKWADVETQYQRRIDLIPNIVNTVKGAANFEQSTLQAVVAARSAWASAKSSGDINAQTAAAQSFDSSLSRLLVTVEAYPNLKSTEAFRDLTTELEGTENRISVARRDFNAAVKDYNLVIRRFPSNIIAGAFGFNLRSSFEATTGAEKAPEVKF
jgi:LemA protein